MSKRRAFGSESHKESFPEIDKLLCKYDRYLDKAQGLAPRTRQFYCYNIHIFLLSQFKLNKIRIGLLHPKDVINFILSYTKTGGQTRAQNMVYSLRSFFRFLKQKQGLKKNLTDCVPAVASHKQSSLPVSLSADELQQLLTYHRSSAIGLRNYAILMLLVHLGLRASEICKLTLNDIDWANGEIIICGKGSTETRLPIFKYLGKALIAYLQHGRPNCHSNMFFITAKRPYKGFQSSCSIGEIVRSALKQAGLNPEKKGAHLLRHSLATQLLRQGATFQEIGVILRHKHIGTTAIYARVDFDKLRSIALPWPHNYKKEDAL